MFPIMALLLLALAGPGVIAMTPPPSTFATMQDLDALQKQFGGLHASQIESREEILALRAKMEELVEKIDEQQGHTEKYSRARAEGEEDRRGNAPRIESGEEIRALRAKVDELAAKSDEQQAQIENCGRARAEGGENRRGMQSQGPADEGEAVHIWRRDASALQPTGGHRRVLAEGDCDPASKGGKLAMATITQECCDEPSEDCTGGVLRTCNEGCAAILLPFWQTCERQLEKHVRKDLETAAGLCPAPSVPPPSSDVTLLYVTCPPGILSDETCIPKCNTRTNGGVLLVNQVGTDLRLLCEMKNFLFSVRTNRGYAPFRSIPQ